ncbi:small GTP-binding protein [Tritrichomonas foetus]|uniref:Small GTP-binding protein n=1 Tax=Tritrichomonas foetus TaxID=1144522 RepID=A0A1J4JPZ5_9EUKA|nr:small GTP-binding protein [Tritrichomonas foetus]|eukprot:OHT01231.1 small GTP-binding protein [Tritrichomonas foetus]
MNIIINDISFCQIKFFNKNIYLAKVFHPNLEKLPDFSINLKMSTFQKKYKVVLIGSSSVGKTSIVIRFSKNTFSGNQESTIGAAFISRDIQTDKGSISLHVWDTAGQERYRSLVPKYSQGAAAIIIVYDVTDQESFLSAQEWYEEARMNHPGKVIWFLVANKCDLKAEVDAESAKEFAQNHEMYYIETSAKTGQNIQELFVQIANLVPKIPTENGGLDLTAQPKKEEKKCC